MIKFPKIKQFKDTVHSVKSEHDFRGFDENNVAIYEHLSPYPTITFYGTVKLHGTNAAVVHYKDSNDIKYQSRNRELSLMSDNASFCASIHGYNWISVFEQYEYKNHIAIFGEWIGQGIQKGVAICQLPKMFVIFAVLADEQWKELPILEDNPLVTRIDRCEKYFIAIDFNSPETVLSTLTELTDKVENQCPFAATFGIEGIGEGIVWKSENNQYTFKTKGKLHRESVDEEIVDKPNFADADTFVERTCTPQRLEKLYERLKDEKENLSAKDTLDYLKLVANDIFEEENLTMSESRLDAKRVIGGITRKARIYFLSKVQE